MLARQVTAVISSSGEPHRAGLRQTHLRHQVAIMSKKEMTKPYLRIAGPENTQLNQMSMTLKHIFSDSDHHRNVKGAF